MSLARKCVNTSQTPRNEKKLLISKKQAKQANNYNHLFKQVTQYLERIHNRRDFTWSGRLDSIKYRVEALRFYNLKFSTLGAAYACMVRDSWKRENAEQAKNFALMQISVGKTLNDPTIIQRSWVYIAYYYLFMKRFNEARTFVNMAQQSKDESILKLAESAARRIQNEQKHENLVSHVI